MLAQARPGEQHPFRAKPGTIPFPSLFDLAARSSGGAVLWANADLFAEMVNLIKPAPAEFRPATFGHEGQVYDGWETRRRRVAGEDWAIVRLGAAGVVRGVVVDTSFFTGNFPPEGRPRAYGLVMAAGAIAIAVGPLIGGIATTYFSWRWVFVGEVVIVMGILALAHRVRDAPVG